MKRLTLVVVTLLILLTTSLAISNTIYLESPKTFLPDDERKWEQLGNTILYTASDEVVIYWNGIGGEVDMGYDFIRKLKIAQAQGKTIKLIFVGAVVSMHADVACYVNSYVFTKGSYLIFHNVKNEHGQFMDDRTRTILADCGMFLTQQDIDKIVNYHQRLHIYPNGTKVFFEDWK